ncbi:MAG TPA: GerAB/ArcD/ProY family transporter [Firmicutes bacterium]|jgi:spore germination protein KB|nr:GerAB/ArcD/ProY family transporter [Bacillota bacterium]
MNSVNQAKQLANPSMAAQFDVVKLGHLESNQVSSMLGFLLWTKVFLILPSFIIAKVGPGAWITIILSALLASAGLWGWLKWSKTTGNLGIVPSLRLTLGRVLGDTVALIIALYFLTITGLSVRVFAGGAVIGLLPEFPIEILIFVIIGAAIYSAWLGLESVGRAAVFFFPVVAVSIILVAVGSYRLFDLRHLYPVLGMGMPVLLRESLPHTGLFGAISVTAVLKSYIREPDNLPRCAYRGLVIASIFMVGSVVLVSAVFPYPVSTRQVIPLGTVARAVYLGRFLQRIEALFTFTWFFASAVHASVCYMITLILLCQLMNTWTYRPLVPGVASLTFGIAALPQSILDASLLLVNTYVTAGTAQVALGLLLYGVARATNVSEKAQEISRVLVNQNKQDHLAEISREDQG